jgi:uncharacterized coiled-coil protein SlyX
MTGQGADSERMRKLEESQGFTERAVEELAEEVRELGKRVQELGAKMARLEARLDAAQRGDESGEE